jgi:hypothetical protein
VFLSLRNSSNKLFKVKMFNICFTVVYEMLLFLVITLASAQ